MKKIVIPDNVKKILLHCCCAPCSSAILEWMVNNGLEPTLYYYNPNIFPLEEYEKRKLECSRYARSLGVSIIDADYNHNSWLRMAAGLEGEPERGERCLQCFKMRLHKTAEYAYDNGFPAITTTLASSRWKDLQQIIEAGEYAVSKYPDLFFWKQNWRKNGLSERRRQLIADHNFYNQKYCGCEFSAKRIDK